MKQLTIKIEGMHCMSCSALIKDVLEENGVKNADVTLEDATITYDENKIDEDKIKALIREEVYEV
jgi:copper chaperone CopZ